MYKLQEVAPISNRKIRKRVHTSYNFLHIGLEIFIFYHICFKSMIYCCRFIASIKKMYALASVFSLSKKTINAHLKLVIRVDGYLFLYIRNLENSCFKPVFR